MINIMHINKKFDVYLIEDTVVGVTREIPDIITCPSNLQNMHQSRVRAFAEGVPKKETRGGEKKREIRR